MRAFQISLYHCALITAILLALITPSNARSKAAQYLINQEIKSGCEGKGGAFGADGIYEIDLNSDGLDDLILAHQGISCNGELKSSSECGMQVCSIKVYFREGKLLKLKDEFLARILSAKMTPEPVFKTMGHGGHQGEFRPKEIYVQKKPISSPIPARDVSSALVEKVEALKSKIMNMSYDNARQIIINGGWNSVVNTAPDDLVFVSRNMYDKGYVEVDICSPVGDAPCNFYFKNADEGYLKVMTQGEVPHVVAVKIVDIEEFRYVSSLLSGEKENKPVVHAPKNSVPTPTVIQSSTKVRDVPVLERGEEGDLPTCATSTVSGVKASGFLAVRSGPGVKYREIDKLYNREIVVVFDTRGDWAGVVYRTDNVKCSSKKTRRVPYEKKGWVHKNWLSDIAG